MVDFDFKSKEWFKLGKKMQGKLLNIINKVAGHVEAEGEQEAWNL